MEKKEHYFGIKKKFPSECVCLDKQKIRDKYMDEFVSWLEKMGFKVILVNRYSTRLFCLVKHNRKSTIVRVKKSKRCCSVYTTEDNPEELKKELMFTHNGEERDKVFVSDLKQRHYCSCLIHRSRDMNPWQYSEKQKHFIEDMKKIGYEIIVDNEYYDADYNEHEWTNNYLERVYKTSEQKSQTRKLFLSGIVHLCFFRHKDPDVIEKLKEMSRLSLDFHRCKDSIPGCEINLDLPKFIIHSSKDDFQVLKMEVQIFVKGGQVDKEFIKLKFPYLCFT